MSDEPGHKAMLYFLEVLMNSNGPLTISQLAGRFGSRSFTAEMRTAAGGNEVGLKKFLLKYPSLFTVKGNMVSLFDGKEKGDDTSSSAGDSSSSTGTSSNPTPRPLPDISAEMEAVQFFQGKLVKKEERWVQTKSLAGHLSQASAPVRNVVGPQLDFQKWLLRHPHIFEVQGELVGLRDGIAAMSTPVTPRRICDSPPIRSSGTAASNYKAPPPPKTPPATRRHPPKTPPAIRRSHSFSEKRAQALMAQAHAAQDMGPAAALPPSTPGSRRRVTAPVTMTANEYNAVRFLKELIERKGPLKSHNITIHFSQAPEGVRKTIGWTQPELDNFLKRNANIFYVSDEETVNVIKNAKLNNVIITGSRPQVPVPASHRTLSGRKGKVFHVAKLWGIIDLGKHEHVFFDKSIMVHPLDDLQKDYCVGETLYFNAVLAAKSSRAKWRATRVWKEFELEPSDNDSELSYSDVIGRSPMSPSMSIEDEINQFLPQKEDDEDDLSVDKYSDAVPSAAGVVTVWNFREGDLDPSERGKDDKQLLTMVPESYQMSASTLGEMKSASAHIIAQPGKTSINSPTVNGVVNGNNSTPSGVKQYADACCQTVSTGDIIATQLYHEAD